MKQARILLAMSGGVDSTVAAALLLEAGYECAGITMKLQRDDLACIEGAKEACAALGIPHFVIDAREEFRIKVIEPFVRAYAAGQTPNPCIACNQHLKFTLLLNRAAEEGYDYLATGHYARIEEGRLLKAVDARKDQSYVLYTLTNDQLKSLKFPLGTYTKDEIRALAAKLGLANAAQPESQDICFIPEGDYAGFIDSYLAQTDPSALPKPGRILTTSGAPVGAHEGIHHFTTGQRRGLGVAGPEPYYVLDLDPKAATVIIGTKAERGSRTASLDALNILDPVELANGQLVSARHRYQGTEHPAKVFVQNSNTARIEFIEQQPDLTKGQALVLYKEDRVIGGGTIVAYA